MDKTPHSRRRFRLTPTRACAAAGLLALTGGGFTLAQQPGASPGPAARLKPPQPLDEPARPVVRGAAPDGAPGVSVHPPGSAVPPATRPIYPTNRPAYGNAMQTPTGTVRPTPQREPGLIEGAWSDLKGLVTGRPATTTPPFHHPQSQVQARTPTQPLPQAQPQPHIQPQPAAGGVYAGPPAYRWYGWGTTTPGANQYAPTGAYPRGSASWYSQTGATPGAFPVPVMNPYRPEPGAEPPAYARGAAPDATTVPTGRPVDAPPALRYGPATTPASAPGSKPAPVSTVPVPPGNPPVAVEQADYPPVIAQSGPPSGIVQSSARSEPTEGGLTWQRAGESAPFVTPPPTVTVIRGMEPKAKEPSLEDLVKTACHGKAAVTEVRQTGPTQLVVKVRAATPADARAAFATLSEIPVLKPYKVEFEADIK